MDTINLLTTLNEHYIPQLQVMLTSLAVNNPDESFALILLHSDIPEDKLDVLKRQCDGYGYQFMPVCVENALFEKAPVTKQYPKEMYYRLLAPQLLPEQIKKVLYLDPDILIINPIRPLWEMDLNGKLFAAAAHTGKTELANNVNQLRLGTATDYYNSGVLVIDLELGRKEIIPDDIFQYVKQHSRELILPDQDVLNAVYSENILQIEDAVWNYDARKYSNYMLRSGGVCNTAWIMEHTAIIHFCGREKPWNDNYMHRFGILYRHYMQLAHRFWGVSL